MTRLGLILVMMMGACAHEDAASPVAESVAKQPISVAKNTETVSLSDEEWKARLTPEQYRILREEGTERAFSGKYWKNKEPGTYVCAGCGAHLYASSDKFKSGTGWPSFTQAVAEGRVRTQTDSTLGIVRTEIECARCGGHLGHVFDDGPEPTGKRHCVNSASLDFQAN